MSAAQSWFVYYKVPLPDSAEATRHARRIADALSGRVTATPRVMRKVDDAGVATLMEIYEGIADPQAFAAAMHEALAGSGMADDLIRARRTERFIAAE